MKLRQHHLFFAVFILWLFVQSWHLFHAPAFWDEPKIYFRPLFSLYQNFWGYFQAPPGLYDRPWGLHLLYLPFVHLLGPEIVVIRSLNFLYLGLGWGLFYVVACRHFRHGTQLTLLFLGLTPIVQNYSLQYVSEFQLFMLFAAVIYLLEFYPLKTWAIFAVCFFAGMTRETSLALIPAIFLYRFMKDDSRWQQTLLLMAGPLLGLGTHLGRNFYFTGSFFHHLTIDQGHLQLWASPELRWNKFAGTFLATYRLLPLVLTGAAFLAIYRKHLKLTPLGAFCWSLSGSFLFVFTAHRFALPRYYLPVMPFFVFAVVHLGHRLATSRRGQFALAALVLVPPLLIGDPTRLTNFLGHNSGPQDGKASHLIRSKHQEVMREIKGHLNPGDLVITSWPFMEMLLSSHLGYGPVEAWDLRYTLTASDPLPKAILWTNFPEQIPQSDVERWLLRGTYEAKDFSVGDYRVVLYLLRLPI